MTAREAAALRDISGYAAANRIDLTRHARVRMRQRGARLADVRHALMVAAACREQLDGSYRVRGSDLEGDELTCAVAIEDGVLVITLF